MLHVGRYILCAMAFLLMAAGCSTKEKTDKVNTASGKLRIVTTLFPIYDFARAIAGDKGDVTLLLPPGMEPHGFEPRPDDIVRVGKADLFIYTNRYMEPWVETIIKGADLRKLRIVDAGQGVSYQSVATSDDHNHANTLDPHIWLDFGNASLIADNILGGFLAVDQANAAYYRGNAAALKTRLADLDRRFRDGLTACETKVFLHGGHYTFGYLARRYGLEYRALSGISSESEPSASRMTTMVKQIRQSGVRYLFAEELLSPRLTETLASEAGVKVLKLHGGHNLGRDDFQRRATFIGLMEENLNVLQKGLACRAQ